MKNVLVIGASGFVGSYLTKQLLADSYKVRCLARSPDKIKYFAEEGCEIFKGDISDFASVKSALAAIDAVYICIHTLAPQHENTLEKEFMDIELNGLQNIVQACKDNGVDRIVYLTSLGISEGNKDAWTSGRWKTQQYLLNSGLNVTVIQPGMIVGIGGQGFNMALANAQKSVSFVLGNGRNKFRCIAINDLTYYLAGVQNKEEAYGKCYEVGSDDVLTADQLIDSAADVLGRRHPSKIHIPFALLRFFSPLIQLISKSPKGAIKGVLDGLGADMVGDPSDIRQLLSRPTLSYKQSVECALKVYYKN
ncbi:SDR family oxidoreductase [Flavobacterium sp. ENC]|uniref:SDR family oxidoreductase n=1 Tax=Flavobacterium sp. ENC TaxID=2897330 RepID=UPI001E4D628A|nr:NAD(P)H-binding protein [Flavobacterium sp. ENC]MCD0467023.1 NAD(P)H-binding protein [Flavobacterium sp. ENC]